MTTTISPAMTTLTERIDAFVRAQDDEPARKAAALVGVVAELLTESANPPMAREIFVHALDMLMDLRRGMH